MTPTLQDKMLALAERMDKDAMKAHMESYPPEFGNTLADYSDQLRALATVAAQGEEQTVPLSQFREAVEARLYNVPAALALAKMLAPGHRLIYRDSFRWKDDKGHVLPNHYDGMDATKLAADFGYEVTADLGFAAVIRSTIGPPQPASDTGEAMVWVHGESLQDFLQGRAKWVAAGDKSEVRDVPLYLKPTTATSSEAGAVAVAWRYRDGDDWGYEDNPAWAAKYPDQYEPLYATPPPPPAVAAMSRVDAHLALSVRHLASDDCDGSEQMDLWKHMTQDERDESNAIMSAAINSTAAPAVAQPPSEAAMGDAVEEVAVYVSRRGEEGSVVHYPPAENYYTEAQMAAALAARHEKEKGNG